MDLCILRVQHLGGYRDGTLVESIVVTIRDSRVPPVSKLTVFLSPKPYSFRAEFLIGICLTSYALTS